VYRVSEVYPGSASKVVFFTTQYDSSLPEDQRFCQATPSGEMKAVIDNQEALKHIAPGKYFYVDLVPIG
jgi:hypothetical protein